MQRFTKVGFLFLVVAMLAPQTARANFHLYNVREAYKNSDGSVQFVELRTTSNNQQFLNGITIVASQSGSGTRTFTFPSDGPTPTAARNLLIATASFEAACGITPDFILPDDFLFEPLQHETHAILRLIEFIGLKDGVVELVLCYCE